jgi:hypothetical protein
MVINKWERGFSAHMLHSLCSVHSGCWANYIHRFISHISSISCVTGLFTASTACIFSRIDCPWMQTRQRLQMTTSRRVTSLGSTWPPLSRVAAEPLSWCSNMQQRRCFISKLISCVNHIVWRICMSPVMANIPEHPPAKW